MNREELVFKIGQMKKAIELMENELKKIDKKDNKIFEAIKKKECYKKGLFCIAKSVKIEVMNQLELLMIDDFMRSNDGKKDIENLYKETDEEVNEEYGEPKYDNKGKSNNSWGNWDEKEDENFNKNWEKFKNDSNNFRSNGESSNGRRFPRNNGYGYNNYGNSYGDNHEGFYKRKDKCICSNRKTDIFWIVQAEELYRCIIRKWHDNSGRSNDIEVQEIKKEFSKDEINERFHEHTVYKKGFGCDNCIKGWKDKQEDILYQKRRIEKKKQIFDKEKYPKIYEKFEEIKDNMEFGDIVDFVVKTDGKCNFEMKYGETTSGYCMECQRNFEELEFLEGEYYCRRDRDIKIKVGIYFIFERLEKYFRENDGGFNYYKEGSIKSDEVEEIIKRVAR
ncbi:hypothetical protein C1646_756306 [Rhizophagus diaphanus]|nr:hypothetical protein C1646_756306 [Rhizophagus diaphanus] [Rhizophagus sp. MUCL 43196]